jgi:outer membrane protein assembly factor BamB
VLVLVCVLISAPVTATVASNSEKVPTGDQQSETVTEPTIGTTGQSLETGTAQDWDPRFELTQRVAIEPTNETSLVSGQTYLFSVKTSVEATNFLEVWKKSSITNPELDLEVSSEQGETPKITGIASSGNSYDDSDDSIAAEEYSFSAETFDAGAVHRTMVRIRVPEGAERFTLTATATQENGQKTDERAVQTFDVEEADSVENQWERMAHLAEARGEAASGLYDQYDSIVNETSVQEIVNRGMASTFIETGKFAKDIWALRSGQGLRGQAKSGISQFGAYFHSLQTEEKFDGPWVGPIIQAQNKMLEDGLQQAHLNEVQRAGDSGYALQKLDRLAQEEAEAWRNHDRTKAVEKLRKQRDLLSSRNYPITVTGPDGLPDSGTPRFNLQQEAIAQEQKAMENPTLGDGAKQSTVAYFTGLQKFANDQTTVINEVALPMARTPDPKVTLTNKPTVRDQLAMGKEVTAEFTVTNEGGATTEQAYLSLTYPNETLEVSDVRKVSERSDDEGSPTVNTVTDEAVLTKGGDREQIDDAVTDIREPFQAGETNVYSVTFEPPKDASTTPYITYRAAFQPAMQPDAEQSAYIRAPETGDAGPQGWRVKNVSGSAGNPETAWNATYNHQYDEAAYDVISTADGGYLLAGNTTGYRGDNNDMFVVKVDNTGNVEWQQTVGGRIYDHANTAAQGSDGGYIVAGYRSRVGSGGNGLGLVKFDKGGKQMWQATYGNNIQDRALDIIATDDGGYAIAGYTTTLGDRPKEAWLLKIDDHGIKQWQRTYESSARTEAAAVIQTDDGGYALAGKAYSYTRYGKQPPNATVVKTDAKGNVEWKETYGTEYSAGGREYATDIVQTSDGGYTFAGQWLGVTGSIVHVSADGDQKWKRSFGGSSEDPRTSAALEKTADGGYAVVNRRASGERSTLIKTDAEGNPEWKQQFEAETTYDGSGKRIARDVLVTQDGGYIIAGEYKSLGGSGRSAWLEKTRGAAPSNQPPSVSGIEVSPTNVTVGETATLSVPDARDSDGSIQSYEWDTDGDGSAEQTGTGGTVAHTFETAGEYTVTVNATDDDGATATRQRTISVNSPPKAAFQFEPKRPEQTETVTLDGSYTSDLDGSIRTYDWEIEGQDGTTGLAPTTSFETADTYEVTLTVTDDDGATDSRTKTLTVAPNTEPNADAGPDRTVRLDRPVVLTGRNSSDPDGDALSYDWELTAQPEGSTVRLSEPDEALQALQPTHAGTYRLNLTVTDEHGLTDTDSVTVSATAPLQAKFEVDTKEATVNESVQFDASNTSVAEESIRTYRWDFDGDGSVERNTSEPLVEHVYDRNGTYRATLTVVTEDSTTNTSSETITVSSDRILWRHQTGDRVDSSPTVVDGTVYIGSINKRMYALDAETGERDWQSKIAWGGIDSAPSVVDGTVYVGGYSLGRIHRLDAQTGEVRWESEHTGSTIEGFESPTVDDGTVYATSRSTLYAFDAKTGNTQWTHPLYPDGSGTIGFQSSPTVVGETVYTGSEDGTVYALNATTGDKRWQFETGTDVDSSPTITDGTVYVGSNNGNVYALDARTGDKEWRFETGDTVWSSPTVEEGIVYVGSADGNLYAIDDETGTERWRVDTGAISSSSPTVVDETVYVGSNSGTLYAVDTAGETEWTLETGGQIKSSPTVVDGTLYVGSRDGAVYAVDTDQTGSSEGSRARLGTLGHHNTFAEEGPPELEQEPGPNTPPTARLSFAPSNPTTGDWLVFSGFESSDPDGNITSYEWSFDGSESADTIWGVGSGWFTDHRFESAGNHTVSLTVTDDDGASDTVSRTIPVAAGSDDTASVRVADLEMRLRNITECGPTCRNVTYSIENPTESGVSDLTADIDIISGGETLVETEQSVGDVAAGEAVTLTDRIELSGSQALKIQDNDRQVTIEVQLRSANATRTLTFDREF